MFIKDWKKEVFTIPNILSVFRILLIPVYVVIYLNARDLTDYRLAAFILAVSCLTDAIDGFIARRFDMISNLGKFLDPLADKLTQLALTICLSIRYEVLRPVLVLFLIKEFFQLFATIFYFRRGKMLGGALIAGKICTTVLFVSLIVMVLLPGMDPQVVRIIAMIDFVFLVNSFVCYVLAFFGKRKGSHLQDVEQ
ncbi:MAG: CDP-alcohol phosphatidyltransferase family protein [Oscillospiraceae bacterium]|nr:CDP-alcohol phosphatidyltransferase family protein [Oscillospiraceae bacterium]